MIKLLKDDAINKLKKSIDVLEKAVISADKKIEEKEELKKRYSSRISNYFEIIDKQKELVGRLSNQLEKNEESDMEETSRLITLINGLSEMIRDDVIDVVKELR